MMHSNWRCRRWWWWAIRRGMVRRHAVAMPAAGRHAGQRPVATMDHGDITETCRKTTSGRSSRGGYPWHHSFDTWNLNTWAWCPGLIGEFFPSITQHKCPQNRVIMRLPSAPGMWASQFACLALGSRSWDARSIVGTHCSRLQVSAVLCWKAFGECLQCRLVPQVLLHSLFSLMTLVHPEGSAPLTTVSLTAAWVLLPAIGKQHMETTKIWSSMTKLRPFSRGWVAAHPVACAWRSRMGICDALMLNFCPIPEWFVVLAIPRMCRFLCIHAYRS